MLAKLSCILVITSHVYSQKLQFELGNRVKVFAEKTFSKDQGQFFEAIGDVVIINEQNTLYGEAASLNMKTGKFQVEGNVRFVTEALSLWGSYLEYDIKTKTVRIMNARMETDSFSVVASEVKKIGENKYLAKDAEFTTCIDCPESWAVYGEDLEMTIDEYAVVRNGLIRINGVEIFYIPYIVFPIKSKRQSGLLYPILASRVSEGVLLGIPYYWAVDQDKDLTITPTFWASRGFGGNFQYRQAMSDRSWFETDNKLIDDDLYDSQGHTDIRMLAEVESRLQLSEDISFFGRWTQANDLDFLSDFSYDTDRKVMGSSLGVDGFLEWKNSFFTSSVRGTDRRNLLVDDPFESDQSYVQIQPQLRTQIKRQVLWSRDSKLLSQASFGGWFDYSQYRQKELDESTAIRNTDRINIKPFLETYLWSSRYFQFKSRYTWDAQFYQFENNQESFDKYAGVLETELFWGLNKKYGRAYRERILIDDIEEKKKELKNKKLIGDLPNWDDSFFDNDRLVSHSAYRHVQDIRLKHYYIAGEHESGNTTFFNQVRSAEGWFDYDDALRREEYLLGSNDTRIQLAPSNTLELQWNHILFQDNPVDDLGEEVTSRRIAYLNISQGIDLDESSDDISEKLERLSVQAGFSVGGWGFGLSEYYFYDSGDHLLTASLVKRSDLFDITASYNYNSLSAQTYIIGTRLRALSFLHLGYYNQFDINAQQSVNSIYDLDYLPSNKCWKLNLNFQKTLVAERIAFNLILNFGDGRFNQPKVGF